ncbi:MAG: methyltransferase domain-containing protein [Oscillospiraceae bacterium]
MIAEAKRDNRSAKLHFSVQDMFRLPYADKSFDVVIVSNALHIVPQPEKALARDPSGTEGRRRAHRTHLHPRRKLVFRQGQGIFMKLAGFPSTASGRARIPVLPAAERLDGAEKRCSESLVPADLCGMCEIGGVIRCHSLKTPASLWALAGKSWSP